MGHELEAFEAEFAAYCETAHAVGVSSGTEAIVLALRALGIGPGDEVIVPANSFIATAEAVSLVGATPRLVDVDPDDAPASTAELVQAAIGPRTRCVIPVHLMGSTVDMDADDGGRARGAASHVIEDCAQAHGARYHGRRVGTFGDLGCFSFYPTKNLGAWGDGGAVVERRRRRSPTACACCARTARARATTTAWSARPRASTRSRRPCCGSSCAASRAGTTIAAGSAPRCATGLAGTSRRAPGPGIGGGDHVYHLFVVAHARSARRCARSSASAGIATAVHYPIPIHRTGAYAELGLGAGSLPVAERLAEQICTLPLFPLMSDDEVARVIAAVHDFDREMS